MKRLVFQILAFVCNWLEDKIGTKLN